MNYDAHTAVNIDGMPYPDTAKWQLLTTHLRNVAALVSLLNDSLYYPRRAGSD